MLVFTSFKNCWLPSPKWDIQIFWERRYSKFRSTGGHWGGIVSSKRGELANLTISVIPSPAPLYPQKSTSFQDYVGRWKMELFIITKKADVL